MRDPSSSRPPRRAWAGLAALAALIVLQQVTGILSNLVVALLPNDWAHRRAVLVIIMLVIAVVLLILLQLLPFSDGSATATPRVNDEQHAGGTHRAAAPTVVTALHPRAASKPMGSPSNHTTRLAWVDVLRAALIGTGEVLAILGLFVRRLAFWMATRPSDGDKKQETSGTVAREQRATKPSWQEYPKNVAVGLVTTILVFAVAASPGAASPAENPASGDAGLTRLIDADPLAGPSPAWPQDPKQGLEQRGYTRFFMAHTYRIMVRRPNTKVESVVAGSGLSSLGDAKVQVSARASGSAADSWFGLLCRHQPDRYYVAAVDDAGDYQIAKVTNAGKRIIGEGSTLSVSESAVSVLQLTCTGGESGTPVTIALRVNEELVDTEEDSLQPLLGSGGVGLFVETSDLAQDEPALEIAFEDFMVWTR